MSFASEPVKVLYVLGHGRSGSTVLDVILGNHPEIASTGELTNLPIKGWPRDMPCSCGRSVSMCPFWSEVRRRWEELAGPRSVDRYARLEGIFEQYRWGPRLLLERSNPSGDFQEWTKLNETLFRAIREVSGKSVVLDSSKNPLRALALDAAPGVDLYAVYLVRDVRGVAYARKKALKRDEEAGIFQDHTPVPVWRSSIRWVATNLLSEWVYERLDPHKRVKVRYESFTEEPRGPLLQIGKALDLDLTDMAQEVADGGTFRVGHLYGGNRLRMSKGIKLRSDGGSWAKGLSPGEQRLSWLLAGPLMRRHGYDR
jgi:hypothetical protein